ncbi:unnamed protein product [Didymodactylos carnosus]|uniref:Uncharacterized protein n=1 Tax=Didymodactylos carnosus TaxID=1234261 RepID=A0A8S2W1Q9_9BILA|nr:unnamed protein product [Didymodactylos carnosus]CAF4427153.1 unnamed protein product [Didymodactylos carnosus]
MTLLHIYCNISGQSISFYVVDNACRNIDLINALDHMYPDRYKCIIDRNELMDKIEDSKQITADDKCSQ